MSLITLQKNSKRHWLGLDNNGKTLTIIELKKIGQKICCIENYLQFPIKQDQENLDQILGNLSKIMRVKNKLFVYTLPTYSAIIKNINLNALLNEKELNNFLFFNSEKYFGLPTTKINFDYKIVSKNGFELSVKNNSENKMLIRLVAAPCEKITAIIEAFNKASFNLQAIDVEIFALKRATEFILGKTTKPYAIINLEANSILLCILQNDEIIYFDSQVFLPNKNINAYVTTIDLILKKYFSSNDLPLKKIMLCGEMAQQTKLAVQIKEWHKIPVNVLRLPNEISIASHLNAKKLRKTFPKLAIAFGLALRIFNDE